MTEFFGHHNLFGFSAHSIYLALVPKDPFPTLSSIFVETLCRISVENAQCRQSSPTKFSTKSPKYAVLGQALSNRAKMWGMPGTPHRPYGHLPPPRGEGLT